MHQDTKAAVELIDYEDLATAAFRAFSRTEDTTLENSSFPSGWRDVAKAVVAAYEAQLDTIDSVPDSSSIGDDRLAIDQLLEGASEELTQAAENLRAAVDSAASPQTATEMVGVVLLIGLAQTVQLAEGYEERISELEGIVAGLMAKVG